VPHSIVDDLQLLLFAQSRAVNEEGFINIGGIRQWITIHGDDSSKPVIPLLHGGPGSVMSAYSDTMFSTWKKDFILVNWDQRGAGRSFGEQATAERSEEFWLKHPLSVNQMTSDGIELTLYLLQRLHTKKVFLIGSSWGSVLGIQMALKNPELFYAYIGHAQVVDPLKNLSIAYQTVSRLVKVEDDHSSMERLHLIGAPPYSEARHTGQLLRIIKTYEKKNSIAAPAYWWNVAPEYNNEKDEKDRENGDDYSFLWYAGHQKFKIKGMMQEIDFMKTALVFQLPVYLIQGEQDILSQEVSTRTYFNKISASGKQYFLVKKAAHGYNQSIVDLQYFIIKNHLKKLDNKD
jgi:pimeloyl-ACP methyl ester carboxylesterase